MNAVLPTLYERWPSLGHARLRLMSGPTPLTSLDTPGGALLVKDEGRSGSVFGGSEVRKLELVLGLARYEAAVDVLTLGRLGSERLVATLAWARSLGLRPSAVVLPDRDTEDSRVRARLVDRFAEGWFECRQDWQVGLGIARAVASNALLGRQLTRLREGRLDVAGIVGWVSGGLELAEQLEAQDVVPDVVVVPYDRGHTASGLYLGLRLGGCDAPVVAVSGRGSRLATLAGLLRQVRLGEHHLQRHGVRLEVDGTGLQVAPDTETSGSGTPYAGTPALAMALSRARAGQRVVWLQTRSGVPVEGWLTEALSEPPQRLMHLLR